MTRVSRKRPETLRELVGRPVRAVLAVALPDPRGKGKPRTRTISGHRCGVVREEVWADGVLVSLVVQLPGGERAVSGSTLSVKCQGARVRVLPGEVVGVIFRGRSHSLRSWLTPQALGERPAKGKSPGNPCPAGASRR